MQKVDSTKNLIFRIPSTYPIQNTFEEYVFWIILKNVHNRALGFYLKNAFTWKISIPSKKGTMTAIVRLWLHPTAKVWKVVEHSLAAILPLINPTGLIWGY